MLVLKAFSNEKIKEKGRKQFEIEFNKNVQVVSRPGFPPPFFIAAPCTPSMQDVPKTWPQGRTAKRWATPGAQCSGVEVPDVENEAKKPLDWCL